MAAPQRELIHLIAPSGHPNYGDELIVSAWLRFLARRRPRARVVLDCHTPGVAAALHRGEHPGLLAVDTTFRVGVRAAADAGGDPAAAVARARAILADPSIFAQVAVNLDWARRAEVVHVLGGGWINDLWPAHAAVLAAAGELGRIRVATGQGLVPGESLAAALAGVWPRFDLVDVRDGPSRALVPTGASATGDDAWLGLAGGPAGLGASRARPVVLAAQADLLAGADPAALAGRILAILRDWGASGEDLAVLECIPDADLVVWREIAAAAPDLAAGARIVGFPELLAHGLPARPGQRWLSTRYHPHLVAAARGAAGVALDVHAGGYYAVKHGAVAAAGSGWPVVDGRAPARPGPGFDPAAARAAEAAKTALAERIYPRRGPLSRAARRRGRPPRR